jgi:hypothetical protein
MHHLTQAHLFTSLHRGHEKPLAVLIAEAEAQGATGSDIDQLEKEWMEEHTLCTFHEGESTFMAAFVLSPIRPHSPAVEKAVFAEHFADKAATYQKYISAAFGRSNSEARQIAKEILGKDVEWDWDRKPHTTCTMKQAYLSACSTTNSRGLLSLYRWIGNCHPPVHDLRAICGHVMAGNQEPGFGAGAYICS